MSTLSPVTQTAHRLDDVLSPEPTASPEQLAGLVDAKSIQADVTGERKTPFWKRVGKGALLGASLGSLGLGTKAYILATAGRGELGPAMLGGAAIGALGGGGTALGLRLFDTAAQRSRLAAAKRRIAQVPQQVVDTYNSNPAVRDQAQRYNSATVAPYVGLEGGVLLGGLTGTSLGMATGQSDGTHGSMFGAAVDAGRLRGGAKWGLTGMVAGGAVGLLGGMLWRRYRRQQLVKTLRKHAEIVLDIDKGDTLLGGKYKNSPLVVEDVGTDELGQPTVNGKKLLAFRIKKKMPAKTAGLRLKAALCRYPHR
jgi:hypothetical protein